jgi:hypothetical protein
MRLHGWGVTTDNLLIFADCNTSLLDDTKEFKTEDDVVVNFES